MYFLSRIFCVILFAHITLQFIKVQTSRGARNNNFGKIQQNQLQLLQQMQSKPSQASTNISISPEDIGRYINQIRTHPSVLIPIIQQKINKRQYKNKQQWQNAITYLEGLEKVPTCNYSVVLERASMDHAEELVSKRSITHIGNNGSSIVQRIQKYTDWNNGSVSQIIVTDQALLNRNHPLQILTTIIVNEGMPSKLYRMAFFNPQYRYYGVSVRMQGNNAIVVLLLSTQIFKLDYPDQQTQEIKKKGISPLKQINRPKLKQRNNKIAGFSKRSRTPVNFGKPITFPYQHPSQQSYIMSSKEVITAIVTCTQNPSQNSRPPRIIKKIYQDGGIFQERK